MKFGRIRIDKKNILKQSGMVNTDFSNSSSALKEGTSRRLFVGLDIQWDET